MNKKSVLFLSALMFISGLAIGLVVEHLPRNIVNPPPQLVQQNTTIYSRKKMPLDNANNGQVYFACNGTITINLELFPAHSESWLQNIVTRLTVKDGYGKVYINKIITSGTIETFSSDGGNYELSVTWQSGNDYICYLTITQTSYVLVENT